MFIQYHGVLYHISECKRRFGQLSEVRVAMRRRIRRDFQSRSTGPYTPEIGIHVERRSGGGRNDRIRQLHGVHNISVVLLIASFSRLTSKTLVVSSPSPYQWPAEVTSLMRVLLSGTASGRNIHENDSPLFADLDFRARDVPVIVSFLGWKAKPDDSRCIRVVSVLDRFKLC